MEQTVRGMMKKVDEFHAKITNREYRQDGFPSVGNYNHLQEELDEIREADKNRSRVGVVDGLIDLIYVALGALLEAGVNPEHHFDEVHAANMRKVPRRTERYGPNQNDAVKPDGWIGPDHEQILERQNVLKNVSPVFIELTRLRMKKGNNYNRGNVKRSDHFPLGDLSFFQVVWMKMCRVRSMTENPGETPEERAESRRLVERELADIVVYSGFWLENMRGLDL